MEPTHNNPESFAELPQPQEQGGAIPEKSTATQPETKANHISTAAPAAQAQTPANASDPQAALQTITPPAPSGQTSSSSSNLIADDTDLIEKEWVLRAKAIVMHTKDDPHAQNQEMNKVKADYLKKRYNKDLKISES